jgi:hypothetical protein
VEKKMGRSSFCDQFEPIELAFGAVQAIRDYFSTL